MTDQQLNKNMSNLSIDNRNHSNDDDDNNNNNNNVHSGYNIIDDALGYARLYGYIKKDQQELVSPFLIEKYEKDADKYWDKFYKRNNSNFFKDRHWLTREFQEFLEKPTQDDKKIRVFEIGCGVGNTTLPLMSLNDRLEFVSFDFSQHAVKLLQQAVDQDDQYKGRCTTFVYNAVDGVEKLPACVAKGTFDLVVIIFVLSAMDPSTFAAVVDMCAHALRPGGRVLIRDYAREDMAQSRFEKHSSKLGDSFHVRFDGTRAYYFTLEHMEQLYTANGQFETFQNIIVEKQVVNRRDNNQMDRKFIQSKFIRK
ncbi:hypothetical protein DFA_06878 [Cavenderia fasciculata]|uniref:tRNA N(3)-methylcytidine methyltransferase n=1 Tax=Cavenderia fasciculata TaxID=261658 RepID=F4PWX5_CACFS|nr:uncharacterized protein DFA_06878 [Cavenderia fasciculata]EGG19778.1 hypothetical protein DFA_06878 [Cavenderia fasciculata]|eukprot:XP_004358124.1 hypothetical protein DFA_06878 [Cavenderia fasciculata]